MVNFRIIERPAFEILGKKTWISGQDNNIFGRFWEKCKEDGLFDEFDEVTGFRPGKQTRGVTLGVSCVTEDPTKREFYYFIAVEKPDNYSGKSLESYHVPASKWAVFECFGKVPEAIVEAEIYAFTEWLPASEFVHAYAPEIEVYPPESDGQKDDNYCEFWLPIQDKE